MKNFLKTILSVVFLSLFAFVGISPANAGIINYQTIVDGYNAPGWGAGATKASSKAAAVKKCLKSSKNKSSAAQKSCKSSRSTFTVSANLYSVLVYCKYKSGGKNKLSSGMSASSEDFNAAFAAAKKSMKARKGWRCNMQVKLHKGKKR